MTVKLYSTIASPPVRAVILTLKALDVPYELKTLNLIERDHLSEDFKKLNPQHTVPTIEDDGFVIWDSHAINAYLVNKYGKDDKLYPKEPKARAIVDQRLYFDTGVLFTNIRSLSIEIIFKKNLTSITSEWIDRLEEGYGFLEKFLEDREYIAGDNITIADFSVATTIANSEVLVPIKSEKFPLLTEYLKRCESNIASLKDSNEAGVKQYKNVISDSGFKFLL